MKALLRIFDYIGLSLSFAFAFLVRFSLLGVPERSSVDLGPAHFWIVGGVALAAIVVFGLHRLYDEEVRTRTLSQLPHLGRTVLILFSLLFALSFFLKSEVFPEKSSLPLLSFSSALLFAIFVRVVSYHEVYRRMLERGIGVSRVVVVGPLKKARELAQKISDLDRIRYRLVGTVGESAWLPDIVEERGVDEVFLTSFSPQEIMDTASKCQEMKVRVNVLSDAFRVLAARPGVELIDGLPLIRLNGNSNGSPSRIVKRCSDLTISLLSILLLSPLLLLISVGIKLTSRGPVLFRQKRIGEGGKEFTFYKFRSMYENADSSAHQKWMEDFISNGDPDAKGVQKMTKDHRVTELGHFLRRSSLDELPQLVNVLKGEMSLIGPRPPIPYEAELYKRWHKKRLNTKPGITGLWQVSGRSSVSFNDMVLLDIYYAENWSLGLDLEILLKTVPMVISRKGAY